METQNILICKCGTEIPDSEIEYKNSENEEGEEYGDAYCSCSVCQADYETWQWGGFENREHAKGVLIDYINEKNESKGSRL